MLYHENNRLLLVKPTYIVPILLLIYFGHQFLYNMGARDTAIKGYQQCMSEEKTANVFFNFEHKS